MHKINVDKDELAKQIRLAYAEAEPSIRPHIDHNPWETLPDYRKYKWSRMAQAAINSIESQDDNVVLDNR